jgi:hypothetical protein
LAAICLLDVLDLPPQLGLSAAGRRPSRSRADCTKAWRARRRRGQGALRLLEVLLQRGVRGALLAESPSIESTTRETPSSGAIGSRSGPR